MPLQFPYVFFPINHTVINYILPSHNFCVPQSVVKQTKAHQKPYPSEPRNSPRSFHMCDQGYRETSASAGRWAPEEMQHPSLITFHNRGNYCPRFGHWQEVLYIGTSWELLYCWSRGASWDIIPTHAERAFYSIAAIDSPVIGSRPLSTAKCCSSHLETLCFSYPISGMRQH
jgi:hypothetical protein